MCVCLCVCYIHTSVCVYVCQTAERDYSVCFFDHSQLKWEERNHMVPPFSSSIWTLSSSCLLALCFLSASITVPLILSLGRLDVWQNVAEDCNGSWGKSSVGDWSHAVLSVCACVCLLAYMLFGAVQEALGKACYCILHHYWVNDRLITNTRMQPVMYTKSTYSVLAYTFIENTGTHLVSRKSAFSPIWCRVGCLSVCQWNCLCLCVVRFCFTVSLYHQL